MRQLSNNNIFNEYCSICLKSLTVPTKIIQPTTEVNLDIKQKQADNITTFKCGH